MFDSNIKNMDWKLCILLCFLLFVSVIKCDLFDTTECKPNNNGDNSYKWLCKYGNNECYRIDATSEVMGTTTSGISYIKDIFTKDAKGALKHWLCKTELPTADCTVISTSKLSGYTKMKVCYNNNKMTAAGNEYLAPKILKGDDTVYKCPASFTNCAIDIDYYVGTNSLRLYDGTKYKFVNEKHHNGKTRICRADELSANAVKRCDAIVPGSTSGKEANIVLDFNSHQNLVKKTTANDYPYICKSVKTEDKCISIDVATTKLMCSDNKKVLKSCSDTELNNIYKIGSYLCKEKDDGGDCSKVTDKTTNMLSEVNYFTVESTSRFANNKGCRYILQGIKLEATVDQTKCSKVEEYLFLYGDKDEQAVCTESMLPFGNNKGLCRVELDDVDRIKSGIIACRPFPKPPKTCNYVNARMSKYNYQCKNKETANECMKIDTEKKELRNFANETLFFNPSLGNFVCKNKVGKTCQSRYLRFAYQCDSNCPKKSGNIGQPVNYFISLITTVAIFIYNKKC